MLPFLYEINAAINSYPEVYGIYPNSGISTSSTPVGIRVAYPWVGGETVTVKVGGVACTGVSVDFSPGNVYGTVLCTVPAGTPPGDVVVTVNGQKSTCGVGLWVTNPLPQILTVSPFIGLAAGGYTVTVTGTNLANGSTSVTIGGVAATSVVVTGGGTKLTCTAPALSETPVGGPLYNVVVTTSGAGSSVTNINSRFGVAPSAVSWLFNIANNTFTVSGGTASLLDVSGVANIFQSTAAKQPTYTPGEWPGGAPGLDFVKASAQQINGNTNPAQTNAPFCLFFDAIIPAWGSVTNGYLSGNASGGGGIEGTSVGLYWTDAGGTMHIGSSATGYPTGNLFEVYVNGASSAMYVDNVNAAAVMSGSPSGPMAAGLSLGYWGGFNGNVTFGPIIAMIPGVRTSTNSDKLHYLSQQFAGTT